MTSKELHLAASTEEFCHIIKHRQQKVRMMEPILSIIEDTSCEYYQKLVDHDELAMNFYKIMYVVVTAIFFLVTIFSLAMKSNRLATLCCLTFCLASLMKFLSLLRITNAEY